jgi:hypothetical protein
MARYLWGLCLGRFIAAGSFSLGPSNRPLRLLALAGPGQHLAPALCNPTLLDFQRTPTHFADFLVVPCASQMGTKGRCNSHPQVLT